MQSTTNQLISTVLCLAANLPLAGGHHSTSAQPLAPATADDAIPDDWFFSGADRPKELRALEGKPAPEITIQTWNGGEASVSGSKGKVVVIDFWATWCGPCMAAIPENVELVKRAAGKPLAFIGVHDSNSGWDRAPEVIKSKGINYPVGKDSGQSTKDFHLSFWPTYVVIDHEGIVRAAGLVPNKVGEVVEMLLAKVPAGASSGASVGADYFGGAERPEWIGKITGRALPKIPDDAKWADPALAPGATADQVVVLQFFSPQGAASMNQLTLVAELAREFQPQGVVFIGVCDSRASWPAVAPALKARKITIPVMQDSAAKADASGSAAGATGLGSTRSGALADALGIKLTPMTVLVDRTGKVRAAGMKPESLKAMINEILSEPPSQPQ